MIPDRRTDIVTVPFGANYGSNIWGLDPTWITNPAARIAGCRAQAAAYGNPARRVLHLPQGSYETVAPDFNNYPCGVTLQANPAALIAAWTNNPGEEWGVYTGSLMPMNPLGDLFVTGPTNAFASSAADATFDAAQLAPFTAKNFRTVWKDANNNTTYLNTHLRGAVPATVTSIGGEALPVLGPVPLTLDPALIGACPWVAFHHWYTQFNTGTPWTVNPATTECRVWMNNDHLGNPPTVAQVDSFYARGFIPGMVHGVTPAAVCARIAALFPETRSRAWLRQE